MVPSSESSGSRAAVLCVDDDAVLLRQIARCLSPEFRVVTALDGATGLERLEQAGPFAVVIADLKLPGMSGSTFLAEVKTRAPDAARILITGLTRVAGIDEVVKSGQIFRFITKPCSIDELLDAGSGGRGSQPERRRETLSAGRSRKHARGPRAAT